MGHGKETPRQKMIGMMYLVLTALLALNVSKEVLDAFAIVDEGLSKTTKNFVDKNNEVYGNFKMQYDLNPAKVDASWKKAQEVRQKSDAVVKLIDDLKKEIVVTADKNEEALKDGKVVTAMIASKDNTDIPAQIMVGAEGVSKGKGPDLQKKIEEYRDYLATLVPGNPSLKAAIESAFDTSKKEPKKKGDPKIPWVEANFSHLPLISVITIMSSMQAAVRNAEADVIKSLFASISAKDVKVNKIEPIVMANSNYILKGNKYEAEIFLAASDSTKQPKVYLGKYDAANNKMASISDSLEVKNGKGILSQQGTTLGQKKFEGAIAIQKDDGSMEYFPFKSEYQVAQSSVVVSPTKMNVFYIGVDNPVDVSVAGVPGNKIKASINNGTMKKGKSGWVVKPKKVTGKKNPAKVSVQAEIDGKYQTVGSQAFRVKEVPDPVAKIGGKKRGAIKRGTLLQQSGVAAVMENFDFDLKFKVISFKVEATIGGFVQDSQTNGYKLSTAQKAIIKKVKPGNKVYFDDIVAVGPDGKKRTLNTIALSIQ